MYTIGKRIKMLRNYFKLSQKDFSVRVLVSPSYISKVESDKETPSDIFIKLVALEFNISYDWLLYEKGNMILQKNDWDYFDRNYGNDNKNSLNCLIFQFSECVNNLLEYDYMNLKSVLEELIHILKVEMKTPSQKSLLIEAVTEIIIETSTLIDRCANTNINDNAEIARVEQYIYNLKETYSNSLVKVKNIFLNINCN